MKQFVVYQNRTYCDILWHIVTYCDMLYIIGLTFQFSLLRVLAGQKNILEQLSLKKNICQYWAYKKACFLGKSLEDPRLRWVGIENKWSQLNPNFFPSQAPTNHPYSFSWHIQLFIPKITKIKYTKKCFIVSKDFIPLSLVQLVSQLLCLLAKEKRKSCLRSVSLLNGIIFHCL